MTTARTGVLGGRFDPIHHGHLETATFARLALGLQQVLLVPSGLSPHRASDAGALGSDRLAMVTLAAQGLPHLAPSDLELGIDAPSYTALTLARLHDRGYDRTQLFFIVGADAFSEIATWYDYPAVLEAAHFVVVSRPGYSVSGLADQLPALRDRMRTIAVDGVPPDSDTEPRIWLLDTVTPSVSSTQVRALLARHQPVTGLVPPAVAAYIAHHRLYDGPAMSFMTNTQTTPPEPSPQLPESIEQIVDAARDKKAENVIVLDLRPANAFTDHFVICSGRSRRQVTSISESIEARLKQIGRRPAHIEGVGTDWVLIDCFDCLIHVFTREARDFYSLERLWGSGERMEI